MQNESKSCPYIPKQEMKNSTVWWHATKQDPDKIIHWLKNQYHGELTASERIQAYLLEKISDPTSKEFRIINTIRQQEVDHAQWIGELLTARGVTPAKLDKKERYWEETLKNPEDLTVEEMCGVAAHAEEMRLRRIEAIAEDETAPVDIREVFLKILPQERMHATQFAKLAGEYKDGAAENHAKGLAALGLII